MSIIKQAFTYVNRNKKSSAILFSLLLVITHLLLGAILVLRTMNLTLNHLFTEKLPNQFAFQLGNIHFDSEGATFEMMEQISSLSYVRSVRFSMLSNMGSFTSLKPYEYESYLVKSRCYQKKQCTFQLNGVSEQFFMEVEEGLIEITSGRTFTEEELLNASNSVIVSQHLADLNELNIGDILPMRMSVLHPSFSQSLAPGLEKYIVDSVTEEVKIIGFFKHQKAPLSEHQSLIDLEMNLTFFATNTFIASKFDRLYELNRYHFTQEEMDLLLPHHLFQIRGNIPLGLVTLYDIRYGEAFLEQAKGILPDYYIWVSPAFFGASDVKVSFDSMHGVIRPLLFGAIIACLVVVGLVNVLLTSSRRQELGIYLSLGKSKKCILIRLFLEQVWLVLPIALVLPSTGSQIASGLNSQLLREHLYFNELLPIRGSYAAINAVTEEHVFALQQIYLNVPTILMALGVTFLAITLGIIIPAIYVMRLNPKKLLLSGKIE